MTLRYLAKPRVKIFTNQTPSSLGKIRIPPSLNRQPIISAPLREPVRLARIGRDLSFALDACRLMRAAGLIPDSWQERLLRSAARRQLLLCSRQCGKSTVAAVLALA